MKNYLETLVGRASEHEALRQMKELPFEEWWPTSWYERHLRKIFGRRSYDAVELWRWSITLVRHLRKKKRFVVSVTENQLTLIRLLNLKKRFREVKLLDFIDTQYAFGKMPDSSPCPCGVENYMSCQGHLVERRRWTFGLSG